MEELLWAKSEQILLVGVSGIRYSSISKTVAKGRKDSNIKKNEQKKTTNKKEKKTQKKQTHKQTKTQSLGIALIVV